MKKIHLKVFLALNMCLAGTISGDDKDKYLDEKIENQQVHLELARIYGYQKKYDASVAEYKKALKDQPHRSDILLELATIYAYQADKAGAEKTLNLIKDEHTPENIKKIAYIYLTLKEYSQADMYYREYIAKYPDDLAVRLKYAEMLSWQKKYEDSLKQYQFILQAKPDDEQVRRKYALVLIWMGESEKGAEELNKTLHDK